MFISPGKADSAVTLQGTAVFLRWSRTRALVAVFSCFSWLQLSNWIKWLYACVFRVGVSRVQIKWLYLYIY